MNIKFHHNGGVLNDDRAFQQHDLEVCHRKLQGLVKHLKNMTTVPSFLLSSFDNDILGVYHNDYNTIMTTFGVDYAQCELLSTEATSTASTTPVVPTSSSINNSIPFNPFDLGSMFEQCHCKHNVIKNIMEQIYELELRIKQQQVTKGVDNDGKTNTKQQQQQQQQQKLRILQQQQNTTTTTKEIPVVVSYNTTNKPPFNNE